MHPLAEVAKLAEGVPKRATVGVPDGGPPAAAFFCGAYRFEGDLCEGLLAALPDKFRLRPSAALEAIHATPGRAWTVSELAEHALLSRSAFARRFTDLLGVPPLTYVNDWRMALARERLRDTDARLASIGEALGYASEFSFAAAFKRHHGLAPGALAARGPALIDRRIGKRSRPPERVRVQLRWARADRFTWRPSTHQACFDTGWAGPRRGVGCRRGSGGSTSR